MSTLSTLRERSLVLFLVFAAGLNTWMYRGYFFEDAFITYRYAINIAEGNGFVFNLGERVLGTTTPLYTLLLSILSFLGLELSVWSTGIYCAGVSACGYFGARILRDHGAPNAGVVFAVLVAWGAGGALNFIGMETALYLTMIFGAIWSAHTKRDIAFGLLLGCIVCTRYDGAVSIGLILLYRWYKTRKLPVRSALIAGGLLGLWLLFAQIYFGSPMPNTLGAKLSDTAFWDYWTESIKYQFIQFVRPAKRFGVDVLYSPTSAAVAGALVLLPALIKARRMDVHLWLLAVIAGCMWSAYALIGPPANHCWHLTLAVLCLLAFGLAGWGKLFSAKRLELPATLLSLALLVAASVMLPKGARRDANSFIGHVNQRDRVWSYESIARWILTHELQGELLMTLEPGYIAYLTRSPVIDAAGLVTKGIRFHGPVSERDSSHSLAERFNPGLIISRVPAAYPDELLKNYLPVYGYRVMGLLMRKDLVAKHADKLASEWVKPSAKLLQHEPVLRDPFEINFRQNRIPYQWDLFGIPNAGFGQGVPGIESKRPDFQDGYLSTKRQVRMNGAYARGPLMEIDFDVLTFGFGGTDPEKTRAELLVDGVAVMQLGGHGPKDLPKVEGRYFPVYPWRGKFCRVRLIDTDKKADFLVADGFQARTYENRRELEDFEAGEYGALWLEGFGSGPTPAAQLVARFGPQVALGHYSATSYGLKGKQQLKSKPFPLSGKVMSFMLYDFGGNECRAKLLVNGKVVRDFACRNTQGIVPVTWPLGKLQGEEATLVVIDSDPRPGAWTGIDSILFLDGYKQTPKPKADNEGASEGASKR